MPVSPGGADWRQGEQLAAGPGASWWASSPRETRCWEPGSRCNRQDCRSPPGRAEPLVEHQESGCFPLCKSRGKAFGSSALPSGREGPAPRWASGTPTASPLVTLALRSPECVAAAIRWFPLNVLRVGTGHEHEDREQEGKVSGDAPHCLASTQVLFMSPRPRQCFSASGISMPTMGVAGT